jgi:microcystin-dependent protein
MVNPTTVNVLLEAPVHGAEVDTWDQPVNRDWSAIDGLFGGVGIVGVSNIPVTLTKPAAAAIPAPGPFQSQNRVIRFTGAMTGNVQVTMPLATAYIIDNQTTGNFVLSFRALTLGAIVAVPQGSQMTIYNDGTNCFFAGLGKVGDLEFWTGITAMPAWVSACSTPPYLLFNGQVNAFSTFPFLGPVMGSAFGGNGITLFGVPDLIGRLPLSYDATGGRITVAGGAGFNGQTMGAAGGSQGVNLVSNQNGPHVHGYVDPGHLHATTAGTTYAGGAISLLGPGGIQAPTSIVDLGGRQTTNAFIGITITNSGIGDVHMNVQPAQVAGIWVIKT